MKKLLFAALITVALVSSSFAKSPVKEKKALPIFNHALDYNFPNVTDAKWEITTSYAKATFTKDNVATQAFFDLNGDLIGSSHAISIDKLPTAAKRTFAKRYADYTVKEAIEFAGKDESAYYISAYNQKENLVLKVDGGRISVFKRL